MLFLSTFTFTLFFLRSFILNRKKEGHAGKRLPS